LISFGFVVGAVVGLVVGAVAVTLVVASFICDEGFAEVSGVGLPLENDRCDKRITSPKKQGMTTTDIFFKSIGYSSLD